MNCEICQQELDDYLEGRLSPDRRAQIELHLRTCSKCREVYNAQILADRVIAREKELQVNPFLSARVMNKIDNPETAKLKHAPGILKPAMIAVSIAAAVFIGAIIGSIPLRDQADKPLPFELALIDDARLESLYLLSNE